MGSQDRVLLVRDDLDADLDTLLQNDDYPISDTKFEHEVIPDIVHVVPFQDHLQILPLPLIVCPRSPFRLTELPILWKPARLMPVNDGNDARRGSNGGQQDIAPVKVTVCKLDWHVVGKL